MRDLSGKIVGFEGGGGGIFKLEMYPAIGHSKKCLNRKKYRQVIKINGNEDEWTKQMEYAVPNSLKLFA